jgi:hypothetical protein
LSHALAFGIVQGGNVRVQSLVNFFRKIRYRLSLISGENNSYKSYLQVFVASQFLEAITPLLITD